MWTVYIASFLVLLTVVGAMAIGVIFKRKPLCGSCGGLNCASCKSGNKRASPTAKKILARK